MLNVDIKECQYYTVLKCRIHHIVTKCSMPKCRVARYLVTKCPVSKSLVPKCVDTATEVYTGKSMHRSLLIFMGERFGCYFRRILRLVSILIRIQCTTGDWQGTQPMSLSIHCLGSPVSTNSRRRPWQVASSGSLGTGQTTRFLVGFCLWSFLSLKVMPPSGISHLWRHIYHQRHQSDF